MDHIRQFDWNSARESKYFLAEENIDNSSIMKIIENRFRNPLISSDSEEEKTDIDWDKVFAKNFVKGGNYYTYVPGTSKHIYHLKLSSLSQQQHLQCLKVIAVKYPQLPISNIRAPNQKDWSVYESVKHIYHKEQKEFIEWAKQKWTLEHCTRMLKPLPTIEEVYDAEFQMKMKEFELLPQNYEFAAQIPLLTNKGTFEFTHIEDIVDVDVRELPQLNIAEIFTSRVTIFDKKSHPVPCTKHPCRFVLPFEDSVSVLPVQDVMRELAQQAADRGTRCVISERALQLLIKTSHSGMMPVAVCEVITPDGGKQNVVVIGNDFTLLRQSPYVRNYRASRHLLLEALIPASEKGKIMERWRNSARKKDDQTSKDTSMIVDQNISDEEDDENQLVIDTDDQLITKEELNVEEETPDSECDSEKEEAVSFQEPNTDKSEKVSGLFTCTCENTWYEKPAPRSYRKWRVSNKIDETFDIIVHCSHKAKTETGETVLEPIPEYQIEMGGSEQSLDTIKALILALHLRSMRKNVSVMNVRLDALNGELVTYEKYTLDELVAKYGNHLPEIANTVYTTLSQLMGLLPGNYILQHEPEHGPNALLHVARPPRPGADGLKLTFEPAQLARPDEAAECLKRPPTLTDVLLPVHKFRKTLPLAFTPCQHQVAREIKSRKPPPKAKKLGVAAGYGATRAKWNKKNKKKAKPKQ